MSTDLAASLAFSRRDLVVLGLSAAFGLATARVLPPPRLALFHFAIAGGFHHGLGQVWGRLPAGLLLDLRAEPGNPHDSNAVEVLMPPGGSLAGLKLGYLPRDANAAAARWLARGAVLRAEVLGLVGVMPGQAMPDDLVFTSFLNGDPLLRLVFEG
ncbi:MAG: HIRAN domain-containing protein [Acetobacteraceae bacterium]|nr:HIRAN domain-containing protein [Acetobacteraceae bacterium]